ncbi:hypothetical protein C8F04DRAFT_1074305 [Mycena alexandri]|uniref:Uncharacterized protein n=1 Tax=Mycena alexandri TaxID=1745969 RepID=A0AAD6TG45_9AGAR|nr:hypothetical protein C8F04DRAFT_1074305 [Mycena alexandri]
MAGATTGSISLEPASLYVTTTQLSEAKFHWALIETDSTASGAIRHHWHERPNRRTGLAEGYGCQRIQPKSLTGRVVLGYFKIRGYTAPSPATFTDICASTFPSSYATVPENRKNGITCRTWVFQVLSTLCACGYITGYQGTIQHFMDSLERVITEQSRMADNSYLTTFYHQRILTFVSMVMVV